MAAANVSAMELANVSTASESTRLVAEVVENPRVHARILNRMRICRANIRRRMRESSETRILTKKTVFLPDPMADTEPVWVYNGCKVFFSRFRRAYLHSRPDWQYFDSRGGLTGIMLWATSLLTLILFKFIPYLIPDPILEDTPTFEEEMFHFNNFAWIILAFAFTSSVILVLFRFTAYFRSIYNILLSVVIVITYVATIIRVNFLDKNRDLPWKNAFLFPLSSLPLAMTLIAISNCIYFIYIRKTCTSYVVTPASSSARLSPGSAGSLRSITSASRLRPRIPESQTDSSIFLHPAGSNSPAIILSPHEESVTYGLPKSLLSPEHGPIDSSPPASADQVSPPSGSSLPTRRQSTQSSSGNLGSPSSSHVRNIDFDEVWHERENVVYNSGQVEFKGSAAKGKFSKAGKAKNKPFKKDTHDQIGGPNSYSNDQEADNNPESMQAALSGLQDMASYQELETCHETVDFLEFSETESLKTLHLPVQQDISKESTITQPLRRDPENPHSITRIDPITSNAPTSSCSLDRFIDASNSSETDTSDMQNTFTAASPGDSLDAEYSAEINKCLNAKNNLREKQKDSTDSKKSFISAGATSDDFSSLEFDEPPTSSHAEKPTEVQVEIGSSDGTFSSSSIPQNGASSHRSNDVENGNNVENGNASLSPSLPLMQIKNETAEEKRLLWKMQGKKKRLNKGSDEEKDEGGCKEEEIPHIKEDSDDEDGKKCKELKRMLKPSSCAISSMGSSSTSNEQKNGTQMGTRIQGDSDNPMMLRGLKVGKASATIGRRDIANGMKDLADLIEKIANKYNVNLTNLEKTRLID